MKRPSYSGLEAEPAMKSPPWIHTRTGSGLPSGDRKSTSSGTNTFRNSLEVSFIFFILVPHSISLGRCDHVTFSVCWMSKGDSLQRHSGNLWLNNTALKAVRRPGKVSSMTVSPGVENKLTVQYAGSVEAWMIRFTPARKFPETRGRQRPLREPNKATKSFLDSLAPSDVFACETGTLFFHQDDNFFVATGHTSRLPVQLESRSPSMLLASWPRGAGPHRVTLYRTELGALSALSTDTTTHDHYRFTALDACTPYTACVEAAGSRAFVCLATITDPDPPKDLEVTSYNSSSLSVSWNCPERYSSFLLTSFYLDGEERTAQEVLSWHDDDKSTHFLSGLEPCARVRFGLQTVCQAGSERRFSKMLFNDGNSAYSSVESLRQTAFGADNYTLSWSVRNSSSVSSFRVYHEGSLQGVTLLSSYTVGGLLPCRLYDARVEALCGDAVLMSSKTVTAHTGPPGVSSLHYRSNDSVAEWTPRGAGRQAAAAFLYELSLQNGSRVLSSHVTDAALRLPGLEEGKAYVLDVWEECGGHWESEHSQVQFRAANSSLDLLLRAAAGSGESVELQLQLDLPLMGVMMVLPWSLPEELQDEESEPRTRMRTILRDKLQDLLKGFHRPARVEVATLEPADDPDKTEILFVSFDASRPDEDVALPLEEQLDHIRSLRTRNLTVTHGVLRWDGPDLCSSSVCPPSSLCINTLGSFTCVCKHGYYDVSVVMETTAIASRPTCRRNGLFSQCLAKAVTGGIAKSYLVSHFGGAVDVRLNDGRCSVNQTEDFFYFRSTRKPAACGTQRTMNETHIELVNTLKVTLAKEETISRRDLKIVLKCVYRRHYVRNAHVSVDTEWLSSVSLVEFNSSLQLGLALTLHPDQSYSSSYKQSVNVAMDDSLFLQVALQTQHSFASDFLLQVDSCWATESIDPDDPVQGVLLQDGCAVDSTFRWLSENGVSQISRFSVQMFRMPEGRPLYLHCQANVCAPNEDCTKKCSEQPRPKRSVSPAEGRRGAVVSAGPVVVTRRSTSAVQPSHWSERVTVISLVGGAIGFLALTVLSVSATKAIMSYYERLRRQ